MTSLRHALADYLAMRRAMGYRLARAEKLLAQFLTYLDDCGETRLRTETSLAWATLPTGADPSWWTSRLTVVRGFATYLHTIDPATQIPPADLLPARARRATPYPYTDEDVAALLAATSGLRTTHRAATYRTLIGLLVVTGMRIGEGCGSSSSAAQPVSAAAARQEAVGSVNAVVVVRKRRRGPVSDGTCAVSDRWGFSAGTRALRGRSQYASKRRLPVAA